MDQLAISGARWVVGKALGSVMDGVLGAWTASKGLGSNVEALKKELLYAQAMLDIAHGREASSAALEELLLQLQQQAYNADDVLDELDYFRIHNEIYGTFEAADADARGWIRDAVLHARHAAANGVFCCFAPASQQHTLPAANGSNEQDEDRQRPQQGKARRQVSCFPWRRAEHRQHQHTLPVANGLQEEEEEEDEEDEEEESEDKATAMEEEEEEQQGKERQVSCFPWRRVQQRQGSRPGTHEPNAEGQRTAGHTFRATVGKHFPCCSFRPPVQPDAASGVMMDVIAPDITVRFDRVELAKRLQAIVDELKPLCAKVQVILNLELLNCNRSIANDIKTRPIVNPDILVYKFLGREAEAAKIMDLITKGDGCQKDLTVLPIVGLGGMGKSTLAKHIYDTVEEKDFHVKIWISVSFNFSVDRLLKEILKQTGEGNDQSQAPEKLIEQMLKSKRFLLVLDDMWDYGSYNQWDTLLAPLKKGQTKGNIVLVTTRDPKVAQHVKTTADTVQLDRMDKKPFSKLFHFYVFEDEDFKSDNQELVKIGEEIMGKLKGSPLAAKTVGRLLKDHPDDYRYWKGVLESKEWELQTDDDDIMPALKLSYDFLPSHLQRCFSYCALFPQDYEFDRKEIIYWWIGLDILQSDHQNKILEDIGESRLNELITRGFFKKEERRDTRTCYVIHDLLHDLGLKVASRECLSINPSNVGRSVEIWPSIRHLSFIIDKDTCDSDLQTAEYDLRILEKKLKVGNLQSLMIFGSIGENFKFTRFFNGLIERASGLRVLHLRNLYPPMKLSTLFVHMRYLWVDNSYCHKMHLSNMISTLYHLRILHLENISGGRSLEQMKFDVGNNRKLRHFVTSRDIYDKHDSKLCNVGNVHLLQELPRFLVKKESNGFELKSLGDLNDLRELGIYELENVETEEEAASTQLMHKKYLQKLTLAWWGDIDRCDMDGVVLERLEPGRNIQKLVIIGHGSRSCPTWLCRKLSVQGLQSLRLHHVGWEDFTWLEHLPVLQKLKVENCPNVKSLPLIPCTKTLRSVSINVCASQQVSVLEYEQQFTRVAIAGMKKARSLDEVLAWSNLAELNRLFIRDCGELSLVRVVEGREQQEGLQTLRCLQELEIANCPKLLYANHKTSAASSSSLCYPFPPSLRILSIRGPVVTGTLPPLSAGSDPAPTLELHTENIAGVLTAPICSILFSSITSLSVFMDDVVERFTEEQGEALQLLTNLQILQFEYCKMLQCLPAGLHNLPNLKILKIDNCQAVTSLPKDGLPVSLHKLKIKECPGISSLPEEGLPISLQTLDIRHCDNEALEQQCRDYCRDHPQISLKIW